jgi:ribosome-associated heat shock protein Hsp15
MRLDKWLWAARFFKTRSLASQACDIGRVESNGQTAKPSREVRVGDHLHVRSPSGEYYVDVLVLSEIRGSAAIAQTLYLETEASREQRQRVVEERKVMAQLDVLPEGRPSKRDRRKINALRGRV